MGSNMSLVRPKKELKKIVEQEKKQSAYQHFCDKWFLKTPNGEFKKTIRDSCPKYFPKSGYFVFQISVYVAEL